MKKVKDVTATCVVEQALRATDDFLNIKMLSAMTSKTKEQVHSALNMLRNYGVVDVIIDNGIGWWYALPKENDKRQKTVAERTPESKPRRPKRKKKGEEA